MIGRAPTGFADTLDPKHGNKLGIIDIQYQYMMMAAAPRRRRQDERLRARQGAADRLQEGRRAHLSDQRGLRPGAQDRGDRPAASCGRRAPCSGRTPASTCETVAPIEGVPMYVSGFVMPKNAPNKDGAYAYLNAMLEQARAGGLRGRHGLQPDRHQRQGARPTCRSASASPTEEQKRLVDLDYGYHRQERRRLPGVVEQGRSRADEPLTS